MKSPVPIPDSLRHIVKKPQTPKTKSRKAFNSIALAPLVDAVRGPLALYTHQNKTVQLKGNMAHSESELARDNINGATQQPVPYKE